MFPSAFECSSVSAEEVKELLDRDLLCATSENNWASPNVGFVPHYVLTTLRTSQSPITLCALYLPRAHHLLAEWEKEREGVAGVLNLLR